MGNMPFLCVTDKSNTKLRDKPEVRQPIPSAAPPFLAFLAFHFPLLCPQIVFIVPSIRVDVTSIHGCRICCVANASHRRDTVWGIGHVYSNADIALNKQPHSYIIQFCVFMMSFVHLFISFISL